MLSSVEAEDWRSAAATLRRVHRAWRHLRPHGQPPLVAATLEKSLRRLRIAVRRRRPVAALRAALDVQESGLDLQLRYRPRGAVDRDRLELWAQRLRVDARARDADGVSGDAATLDWIRDRVAGTLPSAALQELARLQDAADQRRTAAAGDHAARLIGLLRTLPRL
jgi:hypothetical protein